MIVFYISIVDVKRQFQLCREYITLVEKYPPCHPSIVRRHVFFMLFDCFQVNMDQYDLLCLAENNDDFIIIINELQIRSKEHRQYTPLDDSEKNKQRARRRDGSVAPPPWPVGGGGMNVAVSGKDTVSHSSSNPSNGSGGSSSSVNSSGSNNSDSNRKESNKGHNQNTKVPLSSSVSHQQLKNVNDEVKLGEKRKRYEEIYGVNKTTPVPHSGSNKNKNKNNSNTNVNSHAGGMNKHNAKKHRPIDKGDLSRFD